MKEAARKESEREAREGREEGGKRGRPWSAFETSNGRARGSGVERRWDAQHKRTQANRQ